MTGGAGPPGRPGAADGRWGRLTYTVTERGLNPHGRGWQVKDAAGLTDAEVALVSGAVRELRLAERPSPFVTPAQAAALPRRLAWLPDRATGAGLLLHTVAAGPDASARPDNAFTDAVLDRWGGDPRGRGRWVRPVERWRSPGWLTPFGYEEVEATALGGDPAPPEPSGQVTRSSALEFVVELGRWRPPVLRCLLDALVHGWGVALVTRTTDDAAQWIAAASYLAPPGYSARWSFSTFERGADLARTDLPQVVAVLADDPEPVPDLPGRVLLRDDPAAEVDRELGEGRWVDARGRPVPVTPWSQIAGWALDMKGAEAAELLSAMDGSDKDQPARALGEAVAGWPRMRGIRDRVHSLLAGLDAPAARTAPPAAGPPASGPRATAAPAPPARARPLPTAPAAGTAAATTTPAADAAAREARARPQTVQALLALLHADLAPGGPQDLGAALAGYLEAVQQDPGWLVRAGDGPSGGTFVPVPAPLHRLGRDDPARARCEQAALRLLRRAGGSQGSGDAPWRLRLVDLLVRCGVVDGPPGAGPPTELGTAVAKAARWAAHDLAGGGGHTALARAGDLAPATVRWVLAPAVQAERLEQGLPAPVFERLRLAFLGLVGDPRAWPDGAPAAPPPRGPDPYRPLAQLRAAVWADDPPLDPDDDPSARFLEAVEGAWPLVAPGSGEQRRTAEQVAIATLRQAVLAAPSRSPGGPSGGVAQGRAGPALRAAVAAGALPVLGVVSRKGQEDGLVPLFVESLAAAHVADEGDDAPLVWPLLTVPVDAPAGLPTTVGALLAGALLGGRPDAPAGPHPPPGALPAGQQDRVGSLGNRLLTCARTASPRPLGPAEEGRLRALWDGVADWVARSRAAPGPPARGAPDARRYR